MEYNGDGTCNVCEEGYTRGRWSMAGLCRKCTCASVDGNGVEQCNCATCSAQGYCSSCKDGYIFNSNLQPHLERCTPGNAIITIIIHFQRFKRFAIVRIMVLFKLFYYKNFKRKTAIFVHFVTLHTTPFKTL